MANWIDARQYLPSPNNEKQVILEMKGGKSYKGRLTLHEFDLMLTIDGKKMDSEKDIFNELISFSQIKRWRYIGDNDV